MIAIKLREVQDFYLGNINSLSAKLRLLVYWYFCGGGSRDAEYNIMLWWKRTFIMGYTNKNILFKHCYILKIISLFSSNDTLGWKGKRRRKKFNLCTGKNATYTVIFEEHWYAQSRDKMTQKYQAT